MGPRLRESSRQLLFHHFKKRVVEANTGATGLPNSIIEYIYVYIFSFIFND